MLTPSLGRPQHTATAPPDRQQQAASSGGSAPFPHCSHLSRPRQHPQSTCWSKSLLQRGGRSDLRQAVALRQSLSHRQRAVLRPAAISADAGIPIAAQHYGEGGAEPAQSRGLGSLTSRILYGSVLGLGGGLLILAGGWWFTAATCLVSYQATQEFYGFITSKGISAGMEPPPPVVSVLTSLMCICLSVWTFASNGASTAALAVSGFALLSMQLLTVNRLKFSMLASSVFGLFYCGYLPSFWIKLRVLSAPAITSTAVHSWPVMLGGISHWTVGLVATFMAVACTIAADTGAYAFGKTLGRTQLISISPKKTVEGAVGGLLCSTLVALGFWRFLGWPAQAGVAVGLAMLIFFASLCGDLIESVMKRDAGLKDAGDLIPGHGGLLDRFDSYIFTGAIVYFILRFVTPLFGL